ncbi:protein translocase subunit [Boothiomyces macroporosus]|uniref:Protein translocase subunit n=1 Tax=Boothiomyces macroporosus TaxID=261099 RepID=A0AAD5UIY4_9FUNG|nr:protein translocase subunit [Boothiomyces macroporosus]
MGEHDDFKNNLKLLSAETEKITQSEVMKNAKKAVSNSMPTSMWTNLGNAAVNNSVFRATSSSFSKVIAVANKIAQPVLQNKTVQHISSKVNAVKSDLIGERRNPHFVEYQPKEIRDTEKARFLARLYMNQSRMIESSTCTSLVVSKTQHGSTMWDKLKASIENAVKVENEYATAITAIRTVEPSFKKEDFLHEFAHYNIPDILEGIVSEDLDRLKKWLTSAALAKAEIDFKSHKQTGFKSECKIIDYRWCNIQRMYMYENEIPVVCFKFLTTEIKCYKNKDDKMVIGAPDKIQNYLYYFLMTKSNFIDPEAPYNAYTNNWRPIHRATNVFAKQQIRQVNVFAEFAKSVKRQVEENKDFQKDVKMLSAETEKVAESEAMKNAKKAVTATSEATSKVIGAVGSAVGATLNNPVVKATGEAISKTAETVAEVTQKVAEPILETKAAKTVAKGVDSIKKDVVGIAGNAYFAEYKPKEVREKEKEELLARRKVVNPTDEFGIPRVEGPIEENEEASGVVLHKSSKFNVAWEKFKHDSPIAQKLFSFSKSLEENDSSVMRFWRNLREKTVVEESETVQVIKAIRAVEPTFNQNDFLQETAHFVIPDLLEAYLKGEEELLQEWLTEGAFASLAYGFKAQKEAGLISDCKLVDYRNCEIEKMMLLEEETPIILVKFSTTEILLFRNKKGDIALGAEDQLQNARYVLAFTKTKLINPDAEYNPKTNGWTIVQWARAA